jgi:TolA-binding protein
MKRFILSLFAAMTVLALCGSDILARGHDSSHGRSSGRSSRSVQKHHRPVNVNRSMNAAGSAKTPHLNKKLQSKKQITNNLERTALRNGNNKHKAHQRHHHRRHDRHRHHHHRRSDGGGDGDDGAGADSDDDGEADSAQACASCPPTAADDEEETESAEPPEIE